MLIALEIDLRNEVRDRSKDDIVLDMCQRIDHFWKGGHSSYWDLKETDFQKQRSGQVLRRIAAFSGPRVCQHARDVLALLPGGQAPHVPAPSVPVQAPSALSAAQGTLPQG